MSEQQFIEDFRAAARSNGLSASRAEVIARTVSPSNGERFINVFGGAPNRNRELLIVTSVATYQLLRGTISVKVRWTVPHGELTDVRAARASGINGYVVDGVVLESGGQMLEFETGFNAPVYETEVQREIAAANANVAAEEIAAAALSVQGVPVGPTAADQSASGGSPIQFDPRGPEKVGEAAKQAYGQHEWRASFDLYVKAIDKLHDFYVFEQFQNRQPSPGDAWIVQGMVSAVGVLRNVEPQADVTTGVREATHRLRTISSAVKAAGGNATLYEGALAELARIAPDVDVDDIFWT
jgi:hypothetical protein